MGVLNVKFKKHLLSKGYYPAWVQIYLSLFLVISIFFLVYTTLNSYKPFIVNSSLKYLSNRWYFPI